MALPLSDNASITIANSDDRIQFTSFSLALTKGLQSTGQGLEASVSNVACLRSLHTIELAAVATVLT